MGDKTRDWHSLLDRDSAYGNVREINFVTGVASLVVLAANRFRKRALFINVSDTGIYLSKSALSTTAKGILLYPQGGAWLETADALGYLYSGIFSAISTVAAKNLYIIEEL